MPAKSPPRLTTPDPKDPLGYGLKSTPERLQRFWLIGKGNPYFDVEAQEPRLILGLPKTGFECTADFVNWVATKASRHGHIVPSPVSFTMKADGQRFEGHENLITVAHYWDISWPIEEHHLPGRCCKYDPLFLKASALAERFGIARAGSEPGFPGAIEAVVGYLLVGRWPHPKSLRGIRWTEDLISVDPVSGEEFEEPTEIIKKGLRSSGGEGRRLPVWYEWWKLRRNGKTISEIARETDSKILGSKTFDERTIREGIKAVERLMLPMEKPSID